MTTERDLRNQMAYAKKEAIEEGLAEGRAQGLAQGLAEGRAEGRAEGLAEGLAEGRKEKSIEIARKLLAAGYPKEEVMELTGVGSDDL